MATDPNRNQRNQRLSDAEKAWQKTGTILRRVGRHHFAILKGYLEGLDLRSLSVRYLESPDNPSPDLREVKTTLRWIRDELVAAARRRGKYAYARVINIEPGHLPTPSAKAAPSLDAFRETRDPEGFYSEAELIELFEEEFAGHIDRKAQRNARLREKQSEALVWLEQMVASDPALDDAVDGWLVPALARRLRDAEIHLVRDLVATINGRGQRWYVRIPQVGEKAAGRILKWVQMNKEALGVELGAQVFAKRRSLVVSQLAVGRQKQEGIVPLEYFKPNPELDGSQGINRGESNRTSARNDYEAIQLWLASCTSEATRRSYRKEAERFLLWSNFERGKPISTLLAEDCHAYRDFLFDLGRLSDQSWDLAYRVPQQRWLGVRGTPRWSELWRPFERPATKESSKAGALSEASQKQAIVILKSMSEWLMRRRYLDVNPWDGVMPRQGSGGKADKERSFTVPQWTFLMKFLDGMPRDARYVRLRFMLLFAYGTGLRLSELTAALVGDIQPPGTTSDRGPCPWLLVVAGRGPKERQVAVPPVLLEELQLYLAHRGYSSWHDAPKEAPLIDRLVGIESPAPRRKPDQAHKGPAAATLSAQTLYKALKKFFELAAKEMENASPSEAVRIGRASSHWLRRASTLHAVSDRQPIEMGHAGLL